MPSGPGATFAVAPAGYLDALGGQVPSDRVREAWSAAARTAYADPARLHHPGRQAALVLEASRSQIAQFLGVLPAEVHLASSTRAALTGALDGFLAARPGAPLAVSTVESLAVLEYVDATTHPVTEIPVDALGRITRLPIAAGVLALQAANAEVGTVQPDPEGLLRIADATGCAGRIELPQHASALIASARDWGGPSGVAVLIVRRGVTWTPPPGSERGWLGGHPAIADAAAAAIAADEAAPLWRDEAQRHHRMIDGVRERIASSITDVDLLGDPINRLPHVLTFSALYCSGEAIVNALDRRGYFVASGSACTTDTERPSHVLAAMGALTGGNVRISLPYGVTESTVDGFCDALVEVIEDLRRDI